MNKVRIASFVATPVIYATTNDSANKKKTNAASKSSTLKGCQTMSTLKTNHVSTVLLYDIPIVSLYIEGQERLCLAQISNTLLKQYSYNEIHNRRVALGITCVQCTPVQLEILRRAGAMPISSRRCGMITRREAERLCKSFLGDNAPPRLPEDFAFTVYHKCAWGCRGSFLPSRYNSSRAKCIKCFYCGMFFSPNKFIFHSHRITAGDKYIQPDAANFNSWRRHMILSGHPPEEIVHAWEDVKAMFNGGTRKRLMSHNSLSAQTTATMQRQQQQDKLQASLSAVAPVTTAYACAANETSSAKAITTATKSSVNQYDYQDIDLSMRGNSSYLPSHNSTPESKKRQCDPIEQNVGTVTAAAMVGVTAVAAAVGAVRPINIGNTTTHGVSYHGRTSSVSTLQLSEGNEREMSVMPLSRNFMMDYMWHAHTAQKSNAAGNKNRNYNNGYNITVSPFGLTDYAMHWLRTPPIGSNKDFFAQLPLVAASDSEAGDCDGNSSALSRNYVKNTGQELGTLNNLVDANTAFIPQFVTASAFKPVCQQNKLNVFNAVAAVTVAATTTALATSSVYSTATISTAAQAAIKSNEINFSALPAENMTRLKSVSPLLLDASLTSAGATEALALKVHANFRAVGTNNLQFRRCMPQANAHSQLALPMPPCSPYRAPSLDDGDNNNDPDDDEMVDIETTEDDLQPSKSFKIALSMSSCHHPTADTPTLATLHTNPHNAGKPALAAAEPVWTTLSVSRISPDYYRNEKIAANAQPAQMLPNHVIHANANAETVNFDNIVKQQLNPHVYTKNSNNNQRKVEHNCARFRQSPVHSSTSNDSLYAPAKDESSKNATSSIEIVNTNSITHQHHAYNLGSSLVWKKLLSSEI